MPRNVFGAMTLRQNCWAERTPEDVCGDTGSPENGESWQCTSGSFSTEGRTGKTGSGPGRGPIRASGKTCFRHLSNPVRTAGACAMPGLARTSHLGGLQSSFKTLLFDEEPSGVTAPTLPVAQALRQTSLGHPVPAAA